ncbi:MAG: choice-of-anchor D domain-containing protein, partial [Nitrososphaerota archaeon]
SPGQSGQVTVRFDPSESGSFAGTVQVGINGGQGSVNSSPLVGVAHKIEIEPAELDFGITFVDATEEQKLTVKNQGVTTVPLVASTTAPFTITSEGSFTLAPSETHEVIIQLSPTSSGTYIGNLHLVSGPAVVEVPMVSMAYTFEEWVQALLSVYNSQLAVQGNEAYGVVYNEGPSYDLLLAGFEQLDWSTVNLWRNAVDTMNSATSPSDPQLQEALGLLQSIDPARLMEWLQRLKEAIEQGNFDEVYNQLLGQGMDQLQQAFLLLLRTDNATEAKQLLFMIAQQPDPAIEMIRQLIINLLTRYQFPFPMSYQEASEFADQFVANLQAALEVLQPLLNQLCGLVQACGLFGLPPQGRDHFLTLVLTGIIQNIWANNDKAAGPGDKCSDACQVLKQLDSFLGWIGNAPSDPIQRDIRMNVGFGTILVAFAISQDSQYGFSVQGFLGPNGKALSPNDPRAFLLAEGTIDGKRVVSVIRGDHCSTCNSPDNITDVLQFVKDAINMIRYGLLQVDPKTGGGTFPLGDYNVVALVFTRPGAKGIDDVISALQADPSIKNSSVPVMVIWKDANGEINYKCVNAACEQLPAKIKWILAQKLASISMRLFFLTSPYFAR